MPLITPQSQDAILPVAPMGQHDCRLEWNNATSVILRRYGGKYLMINGVPCVIPAAGVVGTTPLTNNNMYVWCYMPGGVMTLYFEDLNNAPVIGPFGMPVHPQNAAITLVGIAWCQTSGIDGPRLVCSQWNRKWHVQAATGTPSSPATSPTDTGIRLFGVGFQNDTFLITTSGSVWHTTQYALCRMDMRFDDASVRENIMCSGVAQTHSPFGARRAMVLGASGLHSVVPYVYSNVGATAQWYFIVGLGRLC